MDEFDPELVEIFQDAIADAIVAGKSGLDWDTKERAIAALTAAEEAGMAVVSVKTVTRFEVIDENGRAYVRHGVNIEPSAQDDGRTLKVFVRAAKESSDAG